MCSWNSLGEIGWPCITIRRQLKARTSFFDHKKNNVRLCVMTHDHERVMSICHLPLLDASIDGSFRARCQKQTDDGKQLPQQNKLVFVEYDESVPSLQFTSWSRLPSVLYISISLSFGYIRGSIDVKETLRGS